jgi:uncharacterized protein YutE (UPF0331/DUF86 family)
VDTATEERVVETTEELVQDLAFLAEKQSLSKEAFTSERTQNYAVKRALQNVINAVIDIAGMLLVASGISGAAMPATNREKLDRLAAETGIGTAVNAELGQSAGFRNLLAHQYGSDIDDAIVYEVLQDDLWVFRDYVSDVRDAIAAD